MDDIVERLRESADHSERCGWTTHARMDRQAAAEIERLQGIIDKAFVNLDVALSEPADENETIRWHLETILQACDKPSSGWYLVSEATIDEARAAINIHTTGERDG